MADASAYAGNIQKYSRGYNKAAAERIVGHLGIALRNKDTAVVACGNERELGRIRDKWCRARLGLAHKQEELDAGIAAICDRMKAQGSQKCRVTFYYLLAEHFGKLGHLAAKTPR